MRALLLTVVAVLGSTSKPAEACYARRATPFELFDRAAIVAVAKPATPYGTLDVVRVLKGTPSKRIQIKSDPRSSCTPQMRRSGIAFVDVTGHFIGTTESFPRDSTDLVAALVAWSSATNPVQRIDVLIGILERSKDAYLVADAVDVLGYPSLLVEVTASQRDRLVAAAPKLAIEDKATQTITSSDGELEIILARLGVDVRKALSAPSQEAIKVADGRKFEAIVSTDALAERITKAPSAVLAAGAFERCERVRKTSLRAGVDPGNRIDMAYACRHAGMPPDVTPPAAKDPKTPVAERARLLIEMVANSDRNTDPSVVLWAVSDAATILANSVEMIVTITPALRDRLVAALPRMHRTFDIPILLVRLGVPDLDKRLPMDFPDRALVLGFAAARKFESVSSAAVLAAVIADPQSPRLTALAAYDRCERLWGRDLDASGFSEIDLTDARYGLGDAARACRTGVPRR